MNSRIYILIFMLSSLFACQSSQKQQGESESPEQNEVSWISGRYMDGALYLAVNQDRLSGHYENRLGEDGRFSCEFFFEGMVGRDSTIQIRTIDPLDTLYQPVPGQLSLEGKQQLRLQLLSDPGGCSNVDPDILASGLVLALSDSASWKHICLVNTTKAFFHEKAEGESRRNDYIIRGDLVKLIRQEGDWAYVEYNGKTTVLGWIPVQELIII